MITDLLVLNLLRFALMALLFLCIGAAVAVMRLHYRATRRAPRAAGLLPWHVVAVSIAVLLPYTALVWGISDGLGQQASVANLVRIGMYTVGAVFFLAAMWIVSGLQRRRIQFRRGQKVTVRQDEAVEIDTDVQEI